MRDVFIRELLKHARVNKQIMLITGDLGFGVLKDYSTELPAQFINAGVAEQNMTGVAAGLALEGRNVFTYSIGNFPTLRCLEQIRNDVLYHEATVNIISIGGGFSYGPLGMSHHATEDIAIMRALPGLRVFVPCDEAETVGIVAQMIEDPMPSYLRIDKSIVNQRGCDPFLKGRLRRVCDGSRVALIASGGIVVEALGATEKLRVFGVNCAVYSAHTIKPFNTSEIMDLANDYDAIFTIEEHVACGGLGGLVAETFLDAGFMPKRFARICLPDAYSSIVGSQDYLRRCHSLDAESISDRIKTVLYK